MSGSLRVPFREMRLVVQDNPEPSDYNALGILLCVDVVFAGDSLAESRWEERSHVLAMAELRTLPDAPGDGSPTANGLYTWENWNHKANHPSGFPTVQIRAWNGLDTLPAARPNHGPGAPRRGEPWQDGINIHPPCASGPVEHRWDDLPPGLSLAGDHASPFSSGCWICRPDPRSQKLLELMRQRGFLRRILLDTTANQTDQNLPGR